MSKQTKKTNQLGKIAGTTARSTVGGPAHLEASVKGKKDPSFEKLKATNELVKQISNNENKAREYGKEAFPPPEGRCIEPENPMVSGSTLAETISSKKVGDGKPLKGLNVTNASLDMVRVDSGGRMLTTDQGVPIGDNQSTLKLGVRGPALLEDFIFREKITHFDHERIPERVVHARGSGAHGYFECYESLSDLTRAAIFSEAGKRTPLFVRFSTVIGERGSTDTPRDVRGFAVKFYTDEGNWDIVGNNMPVFFIQDAIKFPDLIHAAKPEPQFAMPQAATAHDTFWDFISLTPESAHMIMWVMSDRAIPRSFRMMQGFGVHTFRFVNGKGESTFVKFHWNPVLGTHSLVWDEAVKISGADPDFNRRDLWEAIEAGVFPEFELGVQLFSEEEAERFTFDVLDPTKIVPEELVPVKPIGKMVLNRNPDNFFAETEQVAFCTGNIVPGIDFTNDPLLIGRTFSYMDTQLIRLGGPNFHEIPINAPLAQVHNNQRDGYHRQTINRGRVNYEPNSLGGGSPFQGGAKGFNSYQQSITGDKVRAKPEKFADHYTQATLFYRSQTPVEQSHIERALRFELSKVQVPAVRRRVVAMILNIDRDLAQNLARDLGMELPEPLPLAVEPMKPEVDVSPALSLTARQGNGSIISRKIAVLTVEGVDCAGAMAIHEGLNEQGAISFYVGAKLGPIKGEDGETLEVDVTMEIMPSVLFDAIVIPAGKAAAESLSSMGNALEFIGNAYRHCKPILAVGEGCSVIEKAGIPSRLPSGEEDSGLMMVENGKSQAILPDFIKAVAMHRHFSRDMDPAPV
jgi:catalase